MQLPMKPQMPTMSALLRHDYHPHSSITHPSLVSSSASSSAVKIEPQSSPPLTFTNHDGKIREDSPLTPPPPDPVYIKDEPSDDSPVARRRPLRRKERRIYFREESMTPPDPPKLKVVSVKREKKSLRGSRGGDHRILCPSHGTCTATFSRQHDADRHNLTVHKLGQQWQWDCPVCHKHLMRQDSLERHGLKSKDHKHDRDAWKRAFCKFMSDYWVLTDVDNKTSERKALALREKLNLPP
ncbi:hypothetical protein BDZ89DRAFT_186821 [Hymenopellis radicata]|nr:hypothetical protein BDZ89DRAFT_186821 [Hymenopellis radicata]